MKQLLLIPIGFFFFLMSCETNRVALPQPPILLEIFVSDHSSSYNYSTVEILEIEQLIRQDAENFEVWVAGISILSEKSIEQNVLIEGPFHIDTLNEKNYSIYKLPDVKVHNLKKLKSFNTKLETLSQLMKEQLFGTDNEAWSDVNGALQCAERLAQQERFREFNIRLIILSDLDQDQFEDKKLHTFYFPNQTIIYPIGLNKDIGLETVFPNCRIEPQVQFRASFFRIP